MKKRFFHFASTRGALLLLMSGATFLMANAKPARAESIRWASSFQSALSQAKATGRPVMVDFYTDWCGWCKKLDAVTYRDPRVVAQARNFISVKLNAEREGAQLAQQYQVRGYPNIVFMDGNGMVLNRFAGYMEGPNFAAVMGNIRARYRPSGVATRSGSTVAPTMARAQAYAKQRAAIARALRSNAYGRGKSTNGAPVILRPNTTQIGPNGLILVRDATPKSSRRTSPRKSAGRASSSRR